MNKIDGLTTKPEVYAMHKHEQSRLQEEKLQIQAKDQTQEPHKCPKAARSQELSARW